MECRQCEKQIHPERLAVAPRVRTCSRKCAQGLRRQRNPASAARSRARRRDSEAGLKDTRPRVGFASGSPADVPYFYGPPP